MSASRTRTPSAPIARRSAGDAVWGGPQTTFSPLTSATRGSVAGSAPSGLRPGGAGSERIPPSRKRASATHVWLPQAGHVLTPSSKHSSQSRHIATRRSGKCRCRRSVGASLLTAAGPRGIGRGELPPGHGERWSARDTKRCAVSALKASSSVPLFCQRRPVGRTIGPNQPGAGTVALSPPLRKGQNLALSASAGSALGGGLGRKLDRTRLRGESCLLWGEVRMLSCPGSAEATGWVR